MDNCHNIPTQSYGDFSMHMQMRIGTGRFPISGSFEVTDRCNMRCQHCYIPEDRRAGPRRKELTLEEIERILTEIADAGCFWLLLTGGDPLMRRDFLDIYASARRKAMMVTLFTNGTLITPRIADYLAEWPPFSIEITLYGATQKTYEAVTGIPGSYARCMRGIRLLLERKLPLKLKTVLLTINKQELFQMQDMAAELGVDFRFDPILNADLEGSSHPLSLRLTPEEIVAFEQTDPQRAKSWPERFKAFDGDKPAGRPLYQCGAGKNSFHIDATGLLSMCLVARDPAYDLRQGTFREGWEQFLAEVSSRQYSDSFVCGDCELRPVCQQCPALSKLEHDDPEKVVEFVCEIAHLRQKAFAK